MPKCNKLKTKLRQQEFYCMQCCKRVKLSENDIRVHSFKNNKVYGGTPAMTGYCPFCGSNVVKWIKHDDNTRLTKKYEKC